MGVLLSFFGILSCSWLAASESKQNQLPNPVPIGAQIKFEQLLKGRHIHGDNGVEGPPSWLDLEKIGVARTMMRKYWPYIDLAGIVSLFSSFVFPANVKPLLSTGRSETKEKANRRYLETSLFVHSWFLGDIWNPKDAAWSNAEMVRQMHQVVAERLNNTDLSKINIPNEKLRDGRRCTYNAVLKDLRKCDCPRNAVCECKISLNYLPAKIITQFDMAMTQWLFVSLLLLYPDQFGLRSVSEWEWECFVHAWRSIGYRLGVEDEYNLCSGSLEETRAICRYIEETLVRPQFTKVDLDWEFMTRNVYEGLQQSFGTMNYDNLLLFFLQDVYGYQVPNLRNCISWRSMASYYLERLTRQSLNYFPYLMRYFEPRMARAIEQAVIKTKLDDKKHLTQYLDDLLYWTNDTVTAEIGQAGDASVMAIL